MNYNSFNDKNINKFQKDKNNIKYNKYNFNNIYTNKDNEDNKEYIDNNNLLSNPTRNLIIDNLPSFQVFNTENNISNKDNNIDNINCTNIKSKSTNNVIISHFNNKNIIKTQEINNDDDIKYKILNKVYSPFYQKVNYIKSN